MIALPPAVIVEEVRCEEWRAQENIWHTDGATITTDRGIRHVEGDTSRRSSPDLFFTIEFTCAPEYGAGIGNGYAGAPIISLLPEAVQ